MYKQFYKSAQRSVFWETHWNTSQVDYNLPKDNTILATVRKHAGNGTIVEAGCGMGQFVKMISEEGKNILGLDFATKTLCGNKSMFPNLRFIAGDVLKLPLKRNSVETYVSLGVVEHFEEGPEKALQEAYNALKKEGSLICSVPYHNLFRKVIWKFLPPKKEKSAPFYQYYFTKREFKKILERTGFETIEVDYYGVRKTITDLVPKYKKMMNRQVPTINYEHYHCSIRYLVSKTISKITRTKVMKNFMSHMILFVAKPK